MKILFFIILSLFISSNSYSVEIIDCTKETNFLKIKGIFLEGKRVQNNKG